MRKTIRYILSGLCLILGASWASAQSGVSTLPKSVRAERRLINEGNKLYRDGKYSDASKKYQEALMVNATSAVSLYNLGLSQIRQISNLQDTTAQTKQKLEAVNQSLGTVAKLAKEKPGLAAKANYNLGNLAFNTKDYQKAVEYYKQSLRIDPNDESARRNLRIAQKNLKNQDKNDNKNQNQDKNQDQQDQEKQNQDQKQNQSQNQDQKNQEKQQEQQKINQQAADQILQSMDNKESQTRARVTRGRKGDKSANGASNRRRW